MTRVFFHPIVSQQSPFLFRKRHCVRKGVRQWLCPWLMPAAFRLLPPAFSPNSELNYSELYSYAHEGVDIDIPLDDLLDQVDLMMILPGQKRFDMVNLGGRLIRILGDQKQRNISLISL
jgi:hypothetical protein